VGMHWRNVRREVRAEGSSPRAAANRIRGRFDTSDGSTRTVAHVSELDTGSWSVSVRRRQGASYPYSAVVEGVLRTTDRGCLFEGTIRPGWGTFLSNMVLVVMLAAGALWFAVHAVLGPGGVGSRFGELSLTFLFGMMFLAFGLMCYHDLRRLTDDLEAEFLAAIRR
jgi:hypothetical protein